MSYFHQFNNFWQIHDKIAETFCLVLEVCPAPRTQALDDAQLAAITASRIDWSRRPNSSIRRISSSLGSMTKYIETKYIGQNIPDKIYLDKIYPDKIYPDEIYQDKIHPDKIY